MGTILQNVIWVLGLILTFHETDGLVSIPVDGLAWTVTNGNGSISVPGQVPGGVYTDLLNNGVLQGGDFYYRYNDLNYRWVSYNNWTYTTNIQVPPSLMTNERVVFEFEGLDTAAEIYVDDVLIYTTDNMFSRYLVDVKDVLDPNLSQKVSIFFRSPIEYSTDQYDNYFTNYGYNVLPKCQSDVYKGECHANTIRKMQSSYSWDWGPAFPNLGIWKPWQIIGWFSLKISNVLFNAVPLSELPSPPEAGFQTDWQVTAKVWLDCAFTSASISGFMKVSLSDVVYINVPVTVKAADITDGQTSLNFTFTVSQNTVELWWPNGYGTQSLYRLTVGWTSNGGEVSESTVNVGFRTIELDQSFLNDTDQALGRHFRIKVNNNFLFMKGSNWIPAHVLPEQVTPAYISQLLTDARDTYQNCIRVWGGGIYESDIFYELADQLGILIWEDIMFACSMYPANDDFLANVKQETITQVRRLQHHPSVLLWAANNENEAALRSNWYRTNSNYDQYYADYVTLYVDTIRATTMEADPTRPFVVSSPSNGIESEEEGYVAQDPYDNKYGDVHYYNVLRNGWDWRQFPPCRFASEYGYQSWPSLITLSEVTIAADWAINSPMMDHRQHHPNGQTEINEQLRMHFVYDPATTAFDKYLYLLQVHQAMAIRTETHYYRRMRSKQLDDGSGLTMGALYWQLNDIWQGASWASIEYGGRWKMLHYYAKKFFSPVLISPWVDWENEQIKITVVSDLPANLNYGNLQALVQRYDKKRHITAMVNILNVIESQMATEYFAFDFNSTYNLYDHCGNNDNTLDNCFLAARLIDELGEDIAPKMFLPLGEPKNAFAISTPTINVEVNEITSSKYQVTVTADRIALFVWLETTVAGVFSDNGFSMKENTTDVTFMAREPTDIDILLATLQVRAYDNDG